MNYSLSSSQLRTIKPTAPLGNSNPSSRRIASRSIAIRRKGPYTTIFGIPLKATDEVLLGEWDYASMRKAWDQRSKREAVVVAPVTYRRMDDDDAIVEAYSRAITPRTRVMHLTHLVHWTRPRLAGAAPVRAG